MFADVEARIAELRGRPEVRRAELVRYPSGVQFWVVFRNAIDIDRLRKAAGKFGYTVVRFASLPSKLPRNLAEILWDGVCYVIVKEYTWFDKIKSFFGAEPEGIAKIAEDLHHPDQIYIARNEEGMQILLEYFKEES